MALRAEAEAPRVAELPEEKAWRGSAGSPPVPPRSLLRWLDQESRGQKRTRPLGAGYENEKDPLRVPQRGNGLQRRCDVAVLQGFPGPVGQRADELVRGCLRQETPLPDPPDAPSKQEGCWRPRGSRERGFGGWTFAACPESRTWGERGAEREPCGGAQRATSRRCIFSAPCSRGGLAHAAGARPQCGECPEQPKPLVRAREGSQERGACRQWDVPLRLAGPLPPECSPLGRPQRGCRVGAKGLGEPASAGQGLLCPP